MANFILFTTTTTNNNKEPPKTKNCGTQFRLKKYSHSVSKAQVTSLISAQTAPNQPFVLRMKVLGHTEGLRKSAWISRNSSSLGKNHLKEYALMNVIQRQQVFKVINQDDRWW